LTVRQWEDWRDMHNHLKCAAEATWQAMMLTMAALPAEAHEAFAQACLEKAAERLGYRLVKGPGQ
jgi:hypothetical protein